LTIQYPLDGTLFPPGIAPATFRWRGGNEARLVAFAFADGSDPIRASCSERQWTPSDEQWETIKRRSVAEPAEVTIRGVTRGSQQKALSAAGISISTSQDDARGESSPAVLLSRFTSSDRAANIPEFVNADPGAIKRIRQRFVDDASYLRAGVLNARRGYHKVATREFRQALEMNPKNVEAYVSLAG